MINPMWIHQEASEQRLGFKADGSYISPIGLIVEERFEGIEELVRRSAFTLFLERRHVDSGMPECCVDCLNIRRLAILLLRYRNVNCIFVFRNENKRLEDTFENIQNLISGEITDEEFEYIWTRGRFSQYGFTKKELRSVFTNITNDPKEKETYSDDSLSEEREKLIKRMDRYISEVEKAVPPPSTLRSFFPVLSSLDDLLLENNKIH